MPKWPYLFFLSMIYSVLSGAQSASDNALLQVKKKIAKQKSDIVKVSQQRRKLNMQLRKDDFAIAKVAKTINQTNKSLTQITKKLVALKKEQIALIKQKQQQEKALSHQLRAAYTTGEHDYLKMLFNQERSSHVQRSVTYYQYLNKARIKEIEAFRQTIIRLKTIEAEQETKSAELERLQQAQQQQKIALQTNKAKRQITLKTLRNRLVSTQQQLATLEQEEAALVTALEKLAEEGLLTENLTGLSQLKKQLSWPIAGSIKHSFGTRKQGYLRWKGVLLSAPVGRQVSNIYTGKVIFADWLKGYGLVIVVDHGKGYMSLYGHNQTLLKNVGDTVEAGEPIALVGQSGGQAASGLYFEIRHRGKAVNPKIWCK